MTTIPVIDISPLSSPDRKDWAPVIKEIDHACREIGFLAITGHGISQQQIDSMFKLSERFFAQPLDEKQKIEMANSNNHRGWGSHGAEQLDPTNPTQKFRFSQLCLLLFEQTSIDNQYARPGDSYSMSHVVR